MTPLEQILAGGCELVIPHGDEQPFIRNDWNGREPVESRDVTHDEVTAIVSHGCVIVAHRHPLLTCYRTRKRDEKSPTA